MWRRCVLTLVLALGSRPCFVAAAEAPSVESLEMALRLGRSYLLASQKPAGNFILEYNLETGQAGGEDSGVRQASALWALAQLNQYRPERELDRALRSGLAWIGTQSRATAAGGKYLVGPGTRQSTGQVALVGLALVDRLRTTPPLPDKLRQAYRDDLKQYLTFLRTLQLESGQFRDSYTEAGTSTANPSAATDGQALLLLVQAAKYAGHEDLRAPALKAAARMFTAYAATPLRERRDDAQTRAFYLWGTLAFYELHTSGWPDTADDAPRALELATWLLGAHGLARQPANTADAQLGLLHAWELARLTKQEAALGTLRVASDAGLGTLLGWQLGHPQRAENKLPVKEPGDRRVLGGVLTAPTDAVLQLEATQYQTLAAVSALRFLHGQ